MIHTTTVLNVGAVFKKKMVYINYSYYSVVVFLAEFMGRTFYPGVHILLYMLVCVCCKWYLQKLWSDLSNTWNPGLMCSRPLSNSVHKAVSWFNSLQVYSANLGFTRTELQLLQVWPFLVLFYFIFLRIGVMFWYPAGLPSCVLVVTEH